MMEQDQERISTLPSVAFRSVAASAPGADDVSSDDRETSPDVLTLPDLGRADRLQHDIGLCKEVIRSSLDAIDFHNQVLQARMAELCSKDDELRALKRAWGELQ
jgi:predicted lipoprotein